VNKWDAGLVVHDRTYFGLNPDLNCMRLKEAMQMSHDPQDLRKVVYARLDQHCCLQMHRQYRYSRRGKGGPTRTLVPMASSLRGLYWFSERRNGWKEGWQEGSSCYGQRMHLAEEKPK
jgi:hypothetical protein